LIAAAKSWFWAGMRDEQPIVPSGFARAAAIAALLACGLASPASAAEPPKKDNPSGLPLPRFVSLKADKVHVRQGPGTDHRIAWVFQQAGLPVEVLAETEQWRRVRDADGATGWVFHAALSGRRTVVVLPWEAKAGQAVQAELKAREGASAPAVAIVEAGVIGSVKACDGKWCEIAVGPHAGHIEQKKLWGVYDGEVVK
jgi:SH3-like domain-containing protein